MKIVTWNVNSIRAREERLLAALARHAPDVLCLQELKVVDGDFPFEAIRAAGYEAAVFGQKTYNGVAILSRHALTHVTRGFDDGEEDTQSRLIAATVEGVRVVCVYVPNGGAVGSDKWEHKLAWYERLRRYVEREVTVHDELAVCGDFNIAPDDLDVAKPASWAESVLAHPVGREALERVRAVGLVDVLRKHHPEGRVYSWWDYRMLAFPKGDGLRIDHIFATKRLADRSTAAGVDRDERKGKQASDHAPVWATFGHR